MEKASLDMAQKSFLDNKKHSEPSALNILNLFVARAKTPAKASLQLFMMKVIMIYQTFHVFVSSLRSVATDDCVKIAGYISRSTCREYAV